MDITNINEAGEMIAAANTAAMTATIDALKTLDEALVAIRETLPATFDTQAMRDIDMIRASYSYRLMSATEYAFTQPLAPTA